MSTPPPPPPAAEPIQASIAAEATIHQNHENITNEPQPPSVEDTTTLPYLPNNSLPPQTNCSCSKTRCLKLYCDCFSSGSFCNPSCQCNDCRNYSGSDERNEAIRGVLDRKPEAFGDEIKTEVGWVAVPVVAKKRGRPKGSLNKNRVSVDESAVKRLRGRPRKDSSLGPTIEDRPFSDAIPFSLEEHPQLAMGAQDHSELATFFTRPLFPPTDPNTSEALRIAYSHRQCIASKRKVAASKKNQIQDEFAKLRDKYLQKKLELSLANEEVARLTKETGAWTKKVFDLELEEPCEWNKNLERLRRFRAERGCLPNRNLGRCEDGEERELSVWLEGVRGNKVQQETEDNLNHDEPDAANQKDDANDELSTTPSETTTPKKNKSKQLALTDYPHRIESLSSLGLHFHTKGPDHFETMFQKLIDYKEEHGTLRFPSDEQCLASGDEEFIALQKWVKNQVLNFRYSKKKTDPAVIKRFVDIGFSFDRWYAKSGKKKRGEKFDEQANSLVDGDEQEDGADQEDQELDEYSDGDNDEQEEQNLDEDGDNDEQEMDYADSQEHFLDGGVGEHVVESGLHNHEEQMLLNGGSDDQHLQIAPMHMDEI